ncbi:hypothetical protein E3P81_02386 [Wallemia ichthyophaga]|nr:hypothetical protein E3P97_02429 [Wallemia ichthyophaga]TIB31854.1 hypothetical protein E3P85_02079 [Wallemia ichthyophaga]TIB46169.1 hypothetical protein E3P82_02355 [Wallemia ichthyophaga]TIB49865.1 hypothetical protein E3P81_02386 [Wallemia ichthyophaga]TIB52941.1 hypothetical protein E3P80_02356 [Wallemia ichthyophaga]
MLLGDMGASVLKIEEPTRGDDTRSWLPPSAPVKPHSPAPHLPPESAYFLSSNRNKRSLGLNFKHPHGQSIIHNLVKDADVLVENFLPNKLKIFNLDYDTIKSINPGIIYASITGYGQTGPYANAPGYDVLIEAEAGLMHITGERDGSPVKVGVAITDITTGLYAHGAILAALFHKQRTGEGVHLDINLFDTQLASLANIASNYLVTGQEATRQGTSHPSIVPYQTFPTLDGQIMIGAGSDVQFESLSGILGKREWLEGEWTSNAGRVRHRTALVGELDTIISSHSTQHWLDTFSEAKARFSFGPINNIAQSFEHPQSLARGVVTEVDHPRIGALKLTAPAVGYGGKRLEVHRPPPFLAQHTTEILREEGYTEQQILELRAEGVVVDNSNSLCRKSKL